MNDKSVEFNEYHAPEIIITFHLIFYCYNFLSLLYIFFLAFFLFYLLFFHFHFLHLVSHSGWRKTDIVMFFSKFKAIISSTLPLSSASHAMHVSLRFLLSCFVINVFFRLFLHFFHCVKMHVSFFIITLIIIINPKEILLACHFQTKRRKTSLLLI